MTDRTRFGLMIVLGLTILVILHLLVWAATWPHHHGDPWIIAGLIDVAILGCAIITLVPIRWLP